MREARTPTGSSERRSQRGKKKTLLVCPFDTHPRIPPAPPLTCPAHQHGHHPLPRPEQLPGRGSHRGGGGGRGGRDGGGGPPSSSSSPLAPPPPRTAPLFRSLRLGMASTYYTMADALGLRKLGDLIKV